MKKIILIQTVIFTLGITLTGNFFCQKKGEKATMQNSEVDIIQLPNPNYSSNTSLEEALHKRRSVRNYTNKPLTIKEISQVLWAAQGITDEIHKLRTAPSAGALYPLELYLAASNVIDLNSGIYKYDPLNHSLRKTAEGDKRAAISKAALRQGAIENSSAIVIITAVYERTSVKYGKRAERYVHMEAGHSGQNIYLQAAALGLGTVVVGAFDDDSLRQVLHLSADEFPLAIYPLGK